MDFHVFILFLLSCTTVFTDLQEKKVVTQHEVTEYQGHDATLLCQFMYGNTMDNVTQVQWSRLNGSKKHGIIIFNKIYRLSVLDTFLKDRVNFSKIFSQIYDASIIIRNVKISDQGVYNCDYTIFPSGSYTGQSTLKVLENRPLVLSPAETAGIVTAVLLITTTVTTVGCLFLLKRRTDSTFAHYTKSSSDLQQEVTHSDATILKAGQASRSTSPMDIDIEYASVSFIGQSKSKSLQASANQTGHPLEQESMYAPLKHF